MSFILTITVGPVQDFIATARRSRDLWFGSRLLSELSKAAAERIVRLNKHDSLIFPSVVDPSDLLPDSRFDVVNKIVALVNDPAETAAAAGDAMRQRLADLADRAFDAIAARDEHSYFFASVARAQVADMLEYFWAAYPCENPSDNDEYRRARARAESLLAARKATRDFRQVLPLEAGGWGSSAPKSSLDGQRESVIHEGAYDRLTPNKLRRVYGVRPGERLCGVGMLKRHGSRGDEDSFFSTSHVAALPLLEGLKKADATRSRQAVEKYVGRLLESLRLKDERELGRVPSSAPYEPHPIFSRKAGSGLVGYDGQLLFEERLVDHLEGRPKSPEARADLRSARTALGNFLKEALEGHRPLPYYGLLLADGDRMGEAIDSLESIDEHRHLSKSLTDFAKGVGGIVIAEHGGSLVYAGGDDVLAFVPLHTAIQCARRLADEFRRQLSRFENKSTGQSPTLSVGLVVAHHLEPLSDVLALVRSAEKRAKAVEGKDALAVTLSKRGGVDTTVAGHWGAFDLRLLRFARLHLTDEVPDGAAFELRDLHLRLNVERAKHPHEYESLREAVTREAVRILTRKRARHGAVEMEALPELIGYVQEGSDSGTAATGEAAIIPVRQLADELIVARIFADAMRLAKMGPQDLPPITTQPGAQEAQL